jgi:hypothetical protein
MTLTREVLRAMMRGEVKLRDVEGTTGWVDLTHIDIGVTAGGNATITLYKDKVPVAVTNIVVDFASGSHLTLGVGQDFHMCQKITLTA